MLEKLLLKGSIVVKKAYCDWDRYKAYKATMHEANFELIEIPHVRISGKNSADIRMVVDALDLCYTKSHVDTFVIISGDSDFSPLVSKLRENAKTVIGVGVKNSTSTSWSPIATSSSTTTTSCGEKHKAATRRGSAKSAPKAAAPKTAAPEPRGQARQIGDPSARHRNQVGRHGVDRQLEAGGRKNRRSTTHRPRTKRRQAAQARTTSTWGRRWTSS